ncbi:MAG: CxxxxCH/CxxCH domain-containing protein [Geobacter sp.]|nr:CxxxxCH/CxxCH domain-containing protein [Geobacter sp.]
MNCWHKNVHVLLRLLTLATIVALPVLLAASAHATLLCQDCHGTRTPADIRPLDDGYQRNPYTGGFIGNHRTHIPAQATAASCEPCHPGSSTYDINHRNGLITLRADLNQSLLRTVYGPYSSSTSFPQTSMPQPSSCSNVNCHFERPFTLPWGSTPLANDTSADCSACHQAPPTDGSHGKKHGDYFGTGFDSCSHCHVDHRQDLDPHQHALDAGKRGIQLRFSSLPTGPWQYSGDVSYPAYLPSHNPPRNGSCINIYCHSDGQGRNAAETPTWSSSTTTTCISCHNGQGADNTQANCTTAGGVWDTDKGLCTPFLNMTSNGHGRLVGPQWIRKYPCTYCHNETVAPVRDANGGVSDGAILYGKHVNRQKDVVMDQKWAIVGKNPPSYDLATKVCDNVYCHSDGTNDPEQIRPFAWTERKTNCNTCHGHPQGSCSSAGCHDGRPRDGGGYWTLPERFGNVSSYTWPAGEEWKAAIPMFANAGAGTDRANSHSRHTDTEFTCDHCHASTTINGLCTDCHTDGLPPGSMTEVSHLNGAYHVNKTKDVVFKNGGSYDISAKVCRNTECHSGSDPVWGESVTRTVICLSCHGTSGVDIDDFEAFNGNKGKINLNEWRATGHGRQTADGPYPASGNPPANFPGNPCWYCHDNTILHKDAGNPYRLRIHQQFSQRFFKECGYCHMEGIDSECLGCHYSAESLALQLSAPQVMTAHNDRLITSGCRAASCHDSDATTHNSGSPFWSKAQNEDVRSQYLMMGVCLKCHDDDSGGKCTECHTAPPENPMKYSLGFDPGTGYIKPQKAIASSVHFGYKHYRAYQANGVWKGGKFCWDCHDPHGDSNIYMVQKKVATSTDGKFGKPLSRADVSFTRKQTGLDYARIETPYDGICNVCHSFESKHFTYRSGDNHNTGRICTTCHEHRFTDSHADKQACNSCHNNKPVPRHSGFGLPKDCTKCHGGAIGMRMDVMGQFRANSHHVQGVEISNKHCYACHWESTPEGLIDVRYHEGFNFKNYSTIKFAKVDLTIWGANQRPVYYSMTTAVTFTASNMMQDTGVARAEAAKLNNHCISCHSDQNNDSTPFSDCKTPREYAWDSRSIEARYNRPETTTWGKYNSTSYSTANKKDKVIKAFSAHGNAVANQGGFKNFSGFDGVIPNTRGGANNVTCFDCHSSHGSKVTGISSSYVTFNGTRNGANLKETQAGKGGYSMSYKASSNQDTGTVNPYSAGAGQCFDCHLTQNAGTTPWGYQSTFGASAPIMAYTDTLRFGQGVKAMTARYPYRDAKKTIVGGHLKASAMLNYTTAASDRINGLCTPCHDPHGVSPGIGANQEYAVPLLKGTWLSSPFRDDTPPPNPTGANSTAISWGKAGGYSPSTPPVTNYRLERNTFSNKRLNETDAQFAGLCIRCHKKEKLTDGINKNTAFKSLDRIHESVSGWGANSEHSFSCSKCHQPHNSGLPRLMQTNCLNFNHRGFRSSGGQAVMADTVDSRAHSRASQHRGYPVANILGNSATSEAATSCHASAPLNTGTWPSNNLWNNVTPW